MDWKQSLVHLMQPTTISLNGSRLTVKKKNWTEKQFLQQIMSRIAPSDILLTVFLTKEIKFAKYKAIEINDLKEYIEQALEQMLNRNCTRTKFSERFKRIIDSYNAGGTENEDYYEQLVKLLEELRQEDNRANTEGLTEEELEIYDLLIAGKKLTQAEEQKVKLSAKNLYKKLVDNRSSLLVVDWYKDEQPRAKLKYEVELSLNDDLPESYDKAAFDSKVSLLMNHFADMAVQGYGWIGAA